MNVMEIFNKLFVQKSRFRLKRFLQFDSSCRVNKKLEVAFAERTAVSNAVNERPEVNIFETLVFAVGTEH